MARSSSRGRGRTARERTDALLERVRELRETDAFEAPALSDSAISAEQVKEDVRRQNRRIRVTLLVSLAVLVLVGLVSLLIPFGTIGSSAGVGTPADAMAFWSLKIRTGLASLFGSSYENERLWTQFSAEYPWIDVDGMSMRGLVTLAVIACGCMLACAGLLFQTAFRNPLAAPSMLGISDGVTMGSIIFVSMGYYSVSQGAGLYMLCTYGCGALTLVVVLLLSRGISGRANVFDMLLVGTVIAQLLGGVNGFITNFVMSYDTWNSFYELQQSYDVLNESLTYWVVLIFFVLTVIPAMVLRFRLNVIAFDDGEGRLSGVRPGILRGLALILGSAMQLAAMVSIGQVAMLSLVVPFLVRYLLPSDFRWQFLGNCVIGSIVLLVCVDIQPFLTFNSVTMPIGTVVGFAVIPALLWLITLQKKGW